MNTSFFGLLWFALVGGLGLGDTPVSDSPEMVRAQYEQAAAHLDAGGDFYAVNSVQGQALYNLEKIGPMLLPIQHTQQGNEKPALLEQIKQFMTDHGALTTHTLAASTVPRKDGLRDIKFFVGRDSTARSSHFWRGLAGREPRPARHLPGLSKHTVLALETSMEAQPLWAIVRDGMSRFACDGDARKLQQMLAAARDTIGVDLDVLFDGLGHDLTLALLLDPVETVTLPTGGNDGLTIPKPDFLILVGASNDAALTFVRNFFKRKGGELIPVETEYGTLYQLQETLRAPLPMQFAALMHDSTLYFASTPGVILEQLAAEKHTRLASSERFRNTYDDLETEGNVFFYCDARFRAALNHIQDTTASLEGVRNPAALVMNMLIAGRLPEVSSGWVLVNRPDGLLLSGTGTSGCVRQAINGNTNSYLPLIMGMAIPKYYSVRKEVRVSKVAPVAAMAQERPQILRAAPGDEATPNRGAIIEGAQHVINGPDFPFRKGGGGSTIGNHHFYDGSFIVSLKAYRSYKTMDFEDFAFLWEVFTEYGEFVRSCINLDTIPDVICKGGSSQHDPRATRYHYAFVSKDVSVLYDVEWFRGGPKAPDEANPAVQVRYHIRIN